MAEPIVCPVCTTALDPAGAGACGSCPLARGCTLVCCPACGYVIADPGRSALVRLARKAAGAVTARRRARSAPVGSLASCAAGAPITIATLDGVPAGEREQLLAFGLAPGRRVDVLQSTPVTIVRIEHLELALETQVSRTIRVEAAP